MKTHFAYVLDECGVNIFFRLLNKRKTKILLYHSIVKKEIFNPSVDYADQCLTDEVFERQMWFLKKRFNIISLDEFFNRRFDSRRLNIIVTFDDGFLNNYTIAYPILKKYKLKAAFFITTSFISGIEIPWFLKRRIPTDESMAKLKSSYFEAMDWTNVGILSEDPLITIGSHCKTHCPLITFQEEKVREELKDSKKIIEEKIKKKINYVSYPHGAVNDEIVSIAKQSGYRAGITTLHGFNDITTNPYLLKRNEIGNRGDINIFSSAISGSWDFFKWAKR